MGAIPGRSVYATGEVDNRILLKAIWSRRNHDDRVRQSRTVPFNVRSLFGACNSGTHTHIHTRTNTHTHTHTHTHTKNKKTHQMRCPQREGTGLETRKQEVQEVSQAILNKVQGKI